MLPGNQSSENMRFRRTQGVVLLGAAPFSHSWISPTLLPNASWMGPAVRRLGVDALERVDGYSASLLSALDPSYRGRERERPGHRWVAQLAQQLKGMDEAMDEAPPIPSEHMAQGKAGEGGSFMIRYGNLEIPPPPGARLCPTDPYARGLFQPSEPSAGPAWSGRASPVCRLSRPASATTCTESRSTDPRCKRPHQESHQESHQDAPPATRRPPQRRGEAA